MKKNVYLVSRSILGSRHLLLSVGAGDYRVSCRDGTAMPTLCRGRGRTLGGV